MSHALAEDLARILDRDLERLEGQIAAYKSDEDFWCVWGDIQNPAGTLALHMAGNLEHFVGAQLGGSGYERDREAEFGTRGLSRAEVSAAVARCRKSVADALRGMPDEEVLRPYPAALPGPFAGATTHWFLVHLAGHLTWHLGQMDYHRRLVEGSGGC